MPHQCRRQTATGAHPDTCRACGLELVKRRNLLMLTGSASRAEE